MLPQTLILEGYTALLPAQGSSHTWCPSLGTPHERLWFDSNSPYKGELPWLWTIQHDSGSSGFLPLGSENTRARHPPADVCHLLHSSEKPCAPHCTPNFTGEEAVALGFLDSWQVSGSGLEPRTGLVHYLHGHRGQLCTVFAGQGGRASTSSGSFYSVTALRAHVQQPCRGWQ